MSTSPVNRPFQVGATVNELTYPQLAITMQEVFDAKARCFSMGCYSNMDLARDSRSFTWKWEGPDITSPYYKAKGADRQYSTNVKEDKTIAHEDPFYKDEAFDWYESEVLPGYNVIAPGVKRTAEAQIVTWESRYLRLLGKAGQSGSTAGVHAGGINIPVTGASGATLNAVLASKYAFTSTGSGLFLDALSQLDMLRRDRRESQGSNHALLVPTYCKSLITRNDKFMSKFYNDGANLPRGTFGVVEDMPMVEIPSDYWPSTAFTSDPIAKYNYDFAVGGANLGVPAALLVMWDDTQAPVGQVRHGGFITDVWTTKDDDTNKVGTKACYGMDTLKVWNAGGIYLHT